MNQRIILGSLLSFLLCINLSASAAELLFHAPFDGQLDAATARGSGSGTYVTPAGSTPDKPVFVAGINGKGVDFGSARAHVRFDAVGNIRNDRGTFAFWARRIGPQPPRKSTGTYTYHLAGWTCKDANWVLFYRWEHYKTLYVLHGVAGQSDIGVMLPIDGDDDRWHFYAFTWDGPVARAFVDGRTSPDMECKGFPAVQIESFYIGGGDQTARVIDEVKIFDAPLSGSEIRQMYNELSGDDTMPALAVPRRRNDIRVDGRIESAEWSSAMLTCGFSDMQTKLATATPTSLRLSYDDDALYVAMNSSVPEKVKNNVAMTAGITGMLKQSITLFDANVDADDAFEINLSPSTDGTLYRLVVNGINTHYDYSIAPSGATDLAWNPQWESASTLDSEGWHAEMRIPFHSLGVPTPKPGDAWGMNFFRIWQALGHGKDAWRLVGRPPGGGKPYPTAQVRFTGDSTPVVQLGSWGAVADNQVTVSGQIVSAAAEPLDVEVALSSDSGELHEVQKLTLASSTTTPFTFSGKVQDPRTAMVNLTVRGPAEQTALFVSQVPVMVRDVMDIQPHHYPSAGVYRISVNAGALRHVPLNKLSFHVRIRDLQGRDVIEPVSLNSLTSYLFEQEIKTLELPSGQYEVECSVRQDATAIATKTFAYEKQPTPEWYGNTIGITDKAPKPFTPVVRDGQTLGCWGREYRFGQTLLPQQILTQGHEILAGPIELVVLDDQGKRLAPAGPSADEWKAHTDFRLEFNRSAAYGDVKVATSNWLECDGLLWTRLRVEPSKTKIGKLVVRVPFRKEWSELINTFDYSIQTTGRLKPEGWKSKDTPLWLGNAIGGMQWITETLAPCQLGSGTAAVRVTVEPDQNVFELTLIDVPTMLDKPFEVSWGWIATPVRPPTPGHRGWLTHNADYYPSYIWYYPDSSTFDPRWETTVNAGNGRSLFIDRQQRPDGRGEEIVSAGPYIVTGQCSTKVPEVAYWSDEWSPTRHGRHIVHDYGVDQAIVSPAARSWVDYLVWTYSKTYERQRYIGLYYDCAMYMPDDNYYHDAGYRAADGSVLPSNCILGARRLAQRMYCMLRQREPEQTMIMYHHSGMINMAVLSWSDVYVDGENFASRLNRQQQDYHQVYPRDAFRAQSMGHNFGLTTWFEDQFIRSHAVDPADWEKLGLQPTTHLYGLILLHDAGYWRAYGNPAAYKAVDDALRKYHFDDDYTMMPYWNQKVVSLPDNVFATFYRNDKTRTVLAVFLNNNDRDIDLKLTLDWKQLGFDDPSRVMVDDPVHHCQAGIADGKLTLAVCRADMRLLALFP